MIGWIGLRLAAERGQSSFLSTSESKGKKKWILPRNISLHRDVTGLASNLEASDNVDMLDLAAALSSPGLVF